MLRGCAGFRGVPSLFCRRASETVKERMGSSGLIRLGAIGFMLGGVAWLVLGLSAMFGYLQAIPGREDVVLFAVALVLTAAGLVGLHALQRGRAGLLGRVGFYIALAAIAARISGALLFLMGSSALEWISLPGTVGMLVGFVLFGVATARAGVLPRWYGVVLIVFMPVSLPLAVYGTALFGLVLIVLGYALRSQDDASTERSPRVT